MHTVSRTVGQTISLGYINGKDFEDSVDISTRDEKSWLSAWHTFRLLPSTHPVLVQQTDCMGISSWKLWILKENMACLQCSTCVLAKKIIYSASCVWAQVLEVPFTILGESVAELSRTWYIWCGCGIYVWHGGKLISEVISSNDNLFQSSSNNSLQSFVLVSHGDGLVWCIAVSQRLFQSKGLCLMSGVFGSYIDLISSACMHIKCCLGYRWEFIDWTKSRRCHKESNCAPNHFEGAYVKSTLTIMHLKRNSSYQISVEPHFVTEIMSSSILNSVGLANHIFSNAKQFAGKDKQKSAFDFWCWKGKVYGQAV